MGLLANVKAAWESGSLLFKTLAGATIPSVTPSFWGAFVYETEIHDLYGITVTDMNIDFGGHFYTTKVPFPFAATASPKAGPAGRKAGEE